jgi:anti-sigma factor RsiW
MSAPEFDELLSAYLDNEVTTEERAIVEQRLERSPAVREKLDELSDVSEVVKSLPRTAAPTNLVSRVMEQVRTPVPAQSAAAVAPPDAGFFRHLRHRRNRNTALIAVACLVVAVVLLRRPAGRNEDARMAANDVRGAASEGAAPKATPMTTAAAIEPKSGEAGERRRLATDIVDRLSASNLETVKELIASQGGQVGRTDFFRTLSMNSGEIDVLVIRVTDVRGFAGATQALLTSNGIDLVEIETPSEPDGKSDGSDRYGAGVFAMFVEAEEARLDESLDQIEKFPEVQEMEDFGTLADIAESERQADVADAPSLAEQAPAAPDAKFNEPKSEASLPLKPAEDETVATKPASRAADVPPPEAPKKSAKDGSPQEPASDPPPAPAKAIDPGAAGDAVVDNAKPSDAAQAQSINKGYQVPLPSDEAMQLVNQVQNVAQRDATKQKQAYRSSRYGNRANQQQRSANAQQQRSIAEEPKPGRVLIILQGGPETAGARAAPGQTPP